MTTGFIADAMLGRLARWLRMGGYDTLYDESLDDNELVRLARLTGRVLLTRDHELAARRGVRALLVNAESVQEQLAEVLRAFPPSGSEIPRCPKCNSELVGVTKYEVEGMVPVYVWVNCHEFRHCTGCGSVFWPGTHWERIRRALAGLGWPET